jgi:hypothetical protein
MFRRHARPEPALPGPEPAPEPEPIPEPVPLTSWGEVVDSLTAGGYVKLACPALCRRKGDHAHLRHEAASTDLIVSPAVIA